MSVGAHRILIEEIRQAELAKADFQPPPRQLIKQRQGTALVLDLVSAQCEHLVDHAPGQVRLFAEQRIAHNIQIRIASQPQPRAERRAAGFFDIHQKLGGIVQPHAGVQRHHPRSGFLVVGTKTVRPAVGGVKAGQGLEDEVRLPRDPEARALEMRENRFGPGIAGWARRVGRVGRIRRRGSHSLPGDGGGLRLRPRSGNGCNRHEQNSPDQGQPRGATGVVPVYENAVRNENEFQFQYHCFKLVGARHPWPRL